MVSGARVLVACERSGIVRDALISHGLRAISCDTEPSDRPGPHIRGYLEDHIGSGEEWAGIIAFPPCTRLCSSGARWWSPLSDDSTPARVSEQHYAISFFMMIASRNCSAIAIENPVGVMSTRWRKPDQIIQPWQFGHGETKRTCLWLKGLPLLVPSNVVSGREARIHRMGPGPDRSRNRSRTYQGIADAMAAQWASVFRNPQLTLS